jgi:hypothetical protein
VGSNAKVYKPPKKDVEQRYLRKFSKNGKTLLVDYTANSGLAVVDSAEDAGE